MRVSAWVSIHRHQPKSSKDQLKNGLEDKLPTAIWRGRWRERIWKWIRRHISYIGIWSWGFHHNVYSVCVCLFIVRSVILHVNKCRPRRIHQFELSPLCGGLEMSGTWHGCFRLCARWWGKGVTCRPRAYWKGPPKKCVWTKYSICRREDKFHVPPYASIFPRWSFSLCWIYQRFKLAASIHQWKPLGQINPKKSEEIQKNLNTNTWI